MQPLASETESERVLHACREVLARAVGVELGDEYFYASLPLCVIDAVYSIGVRYTSVQNVVARTCVRFGLPRLCRTREQPPARAQQETISGFLTRLRGHTPEQLASEVFGNRQRTSTSSGILKSLAVQRFALVLARHGIETLQDARESTELAAVEREVREIPGQGSGISWNYFLMLTGRDDLVKPDRRILAFLERALGRSVQPHEARPFLAKAAVGLQSEYPGLAPRTLDHLIWKRESSGCA